MIYRVGQIDAVIGHKRRTQIKFQAQPCSETKGGVCPPRAGVCIYIYSGRTFLGEHLYTKEAAAWFFVSPTFVLTFHCKYKLSEVIK